MSTLFISYQLLQCLLNFLKFISQAHEIFLIIAVYITHTPRTIINASAAQFLYLRVRRHKEKESQNQRLGMWILELMSYDAIFTVLDSQTPPLL